MRKVLESNHKSGKKLKEVAFFLRKCIMNADKAYLPEKLTLPDIFAGEIQTPPELKEFLTSLIMGYDSRREKSEIKKRRIKSIAHGIMYSATGGKVKPSKQIIYGLALKGMSGSKRILEISNRFGHTLSYNVKEERETELAYSYVIDQRLTPYGMVQDSSICAGVAFDNFDRYVETLSGKDALP